MFSCNKVAQVNISWLIIFRDVNIIAQYTRHSSTHFYQRPGTFPDFDHFPLIFTHSLVTALDPNIFSVQKEGSRDKWYPCINFFYQSSGIVHCNRGTILGPQEGFVRDYLGTCLELSFNYTCLAAYMKKEIKQTLSFRMRQNLRGSCGGIKVQ
jgi:hypothetical protein